MAGQPPEPRALPVCGSDLIAAPVIPALTAHLGTSLAISALVSAYGLFELHYCAVPIPPFATGRDVAMSSALGEQGWRTLNVRLLQGGDPRRLHLSLLPPVDGRDQMLRLIDDAPP